MPTRPIADLNTLATLIAAREGIHQRHDKAAHAAQRMLGLTQAIELRIQDTDLPQLIATGHGQLVIDLYEAMTAISRIADLLRPADNGPVNTAPAGTIGWLHDLLDQHTLPQPPVATLDM